MGGLGTHVVQQLTLLGVGCLTLVDHERLDESNLNRYIAVSAADIGALKVDLGARLAHSIREIEVERVPERFPTKRCFDAIAAADCVFGCLDREGPRLVLTTVCSAYAVPYIDLATDVEDVETLRYGGRVSTAWNGNGCLSCLGILDRDAAARDLASPEARADHNEIYGVPRNALGAGGPSVVSVNGVVASLAVTEFMVAITGLREPQRLLTYRGHLGTVASSTDAPETDCYFCKEIRDRPDAAALDELLS